MNVYLHCDSYDCTGYVQCSGRCNACGRKYDIDFCAECDDHYFTVDGHECEMATFRKGNDNGRYDPSVAGGPSASLESHGR